VTLKNSFLDYKELGVDSLKIEVDYTGEVAWYPFQVGTFTSLCVLEHLMNARTFFV